MWRSGACSPDTRGLWQFSACKDGFYTMVNRAYRLSSTKEGFAKECNKLRTMFSKLRYPKTLVDSTTNKFSQEPDKEIHTVPSVDPSVYIVLPFKDQRSADRVRKDIYSLGAKIDVNVELVFTCILISMWFVWTSERGNKNSATLCCCGIFFRWFKRFLLTKIKRLKAL